MFNEPINIGVIGVGHLGQHHVKHYKNLKNVELVGIFDTDRKRAEEVSIKYEVIISLKTLQLWGCLSNIFKTPILKDSCLIIWL